jgi:hypothetical protein
MESWLKSRGYFSQSVAPNFVSLFGGKFFVPSQARGIVVAKLAQLLTEDVPVGLCECALPIMNMYFDIDACPSSSAEMWVEWLSKHIESTWECEGTSLSNVVVCLKEHGDGCHIHWPNIVATKEDLRTFTMSVMQDTGLPGILDGNVYRAGLRIVGCRKDKSTASAFYFPSIVDGCRREKPTSMTEWKQAITLCSIHPTVPSLTPKKKHFELTNTPQLQCQRIDVPIGVAKKALACFPKDFRDANITSVVRISDTAVSIALSTKRCMNLDGRKQEHTGNHAYVIVTPEGAYQKCHNTTTCKNYRSQAFYVPMEVVREFFPSVQPRATTEPKRTSKRPRIAPACQSKYVAREFSSRRPTKS